MITVSFKFDNAVDAADFLVRTGGAPTPAVTHEPPPPPAARSRGAKAKTTEPPAPSEPAAEPAAPADGKSLKIDDVRAALKKVVSRAKTTAEGMAAGQELLAEFECQRIGQLPKTRYAEFIAAAEKV